VTLASVRPRFWAPLAALLAGAVLALALAAHVSLAAAAPGGALQNKIAFNQQMRKLWEDHITWTRLYIVSAAAGLPDQDATAARLLQNQADIGNAVKPFYGDAAGDRLTSLLRQHILEAAQLLSDAKAGNSSAVASDETAWYGNANQIADFLSSANPKNWPDDQMRSMMKSHLDLTLQEAVDRLNGDYPADIADYDKVHLEILQMADMLSAGIIAQFPQKFAPGS
jgi:hypothetical protein